MHSLKKLLVFSLALLSCVAGQQVENDETSTVTAKLDGTEPNSPQIPPSSTPTTLQTERTKIGDPNGNLLRENSPFECGMLQQCEIGPDDNTAKVVGILERKLVKMEHTNKKLQTDVDNLLTKLDSVMNSCGCEQKNNTNSNPNNPSSPKSDQLRPSPRPDGNDNSSSSSSENYFPLQTVGPNPRCLDGGAGQGAILIKRCIPNNPAQEWKLSNGSFVNKATQLCLDASGETGVQATTCDTMAQTGSQRWSLLPDSTIANLGSAFCLTTGAYWALSSACDGEPWQRYDYWNRLQTSPGGYYLVTLHFK